MQLIGCRTTAFRAVHAELIALQTMPRQSSERQREVAALKNSSNTGHFTQRMRERSSTSRTN